MLVTLIHIRLQLQDKVDQRHWASTLPRWSRTRTNQLQLKTLVLTYLHCINSTRININNNTSQSSSPKTTSCSHLAFRTLSIRPFTIQTCWTTVETASVTLRVSCSAQSESQRPSLKPTTTASTKPQRLWQMQTWLSTTIESKINWTLPTIWTAKEWCHHHPTTGSTLTFRT